MKPDTDQPAVLRMKSDRERDGKRAPRAKRRDQQRKTARAAKRAQQGR